MSGSAHCRKRASECVEAAQIARSPEKETLLALAQQWVLFADQADEITKIHRDAPPKPVTDQERVRV